MLMKCGCVVFALFAAGFVIAAYDDRWRDALLYLAGAVASYLALCMTHEAQSHHERH